MSYITSREKFDQLSALVTPLLNMQALADSPEVRDCDDDIFGWGDGHAFLLDLAKRGEDNVVFFYDKDVALNEESLREYYTIWQQYPVIQKTLPIDGDDWYKEATQYFETGQFVQSAATGQSTPITWCARYAMEYIIFPPSMKWHAYSHRGLEYTRIYSTVGFPIGDGIPPHEGYQPQEYWVEKMRLLAEDLQRLQADR